MDRLRVGDKRGLLCAVIVSSVFGIGGAVPVSVAGDDAGAPERTPLRLTNALPATVLHEATLIGNGQIGAAIYGGVERERLALNEVTLWSGEPSDWNNPDAKAALPAVRKALFSGDAAHAETLCRRLQGPYTQAYMPMADLLIRFEHGSVQGWNRGPVLRDGTGAKNYRRSLDLRTAVATVEYGFGSVLYRREYFASYPDKVIAVRFSATTPGRVSFLARMDSLLRYRTEVDNGTYVLRGKAPRHAEPNYEDVDPAILYAADEKGPGMTFACHLRVRAQGGETWIDGDGVHVRDADEAVLLLSAATSFAGFDKSPSREGIDPRPLARARLDAAGAKAFDALRERHVNDYQSLFNRVELRLAGVPQNANVKGRDDGGAEPTWWTPASIDRSPAAVVLGFQYSRYKVIAASRPGGQPIVAGALAGLWNDSVRPPWSDNHTLNEALQKMYSGVEIANLSECAEPYAEFMRGLAANGRKTAEINYGLPGWVAHHNTDLWRHTGAVGRFGEGDPSWACFPLGGVWLCENLYNHYAFTLDTAYLRGTAYPVLKGAAEFALAWLVEDPKSGELVTAPSTSPENKYRLPNGKAVSVNVGSACDLSLIWELFKNTIEASRALGVDSDFRERLIQAQARLRPLKIGSRGQILEWYDEYPEAEPTHRHISHLTGLAWGTRITRRGTPELFAAARKSLELRGPGGILPQKLSLCARLGDGELCYRNLDTTLNLAELFVQSHEGNIHFLPALPKAWPEGSVKGLRARGGFVVDVAWEKGQIAGAVVRATVEGPCRVRADKPLRRLYENGMPAAFTCGDDGTMAFQCKARGVYRLTFEDQALTEMN